MEPFKLGINMAGAVSAGAYTAGVLDFLMQALDEWYLAKDSGELVPPHDISIEVFSGASAGGMCAAISASITQEEFEHISNPSKTGTTNKLYEAWVNQIDIHELLKTGDLESGRITSLLDSTIISTIARDALTPGPPKTRKYVSPNLTLFLTLTNLRGIPYALFQDPNLTPDEYVTFHADRLRFEMVNAGQTPNSPVARPLVRGGNDAMWDLLRTTAMATGAFPAFLAPRVLDRARADYTTPLWESICQCGAADPPVPPSFPDTQGPWTTVYVDGGVTNNSPFTLAHDYLATLNPHPAECQNPRDAQRADRAVLTIAPFPGNEDLDKPYDPKQQSTLFAVLANLFSALIAQSRFFGESLAIVTGEPAFSRFFIAPSDDRFDGKPLQCGLLSAFGGFFERGFRAHDFQLGRRNCQAFLQKHFILPESNPLFEGASEQVRAAFKQQPLVPNVYPYDRWLPIVPLCGSAKAPIPYPVRAKITQKSLDQIVGLISNRIKALLPLILLNLKSKLLRFLIKWGVGALMTIFGGKGEIKKYLVDALGDSVEQ
ncbi:MAG TPA: patatin-like phospholipase family protein [Bryobacteraceae bacterium]|jgi:predicted acylesterase/phospholipase RssA|nr:patatin-like phospholipase family protein [Bryobacteraceae bacterium]